MSRSYAERMGDSLLDRVTRLPFVIPGDPTEGSGEPQGGASVNRAVPASVLLA